MTYQIIVLFIMAIIKILTVSDPKQLCHVTCGTCPSYPRDINGCETCSSSFLNYLSFPIQQGPQPCVLDNYHETHKNIQQIQTINGSISVDQRVVLRFGVDNSDFTYTNLTLGQQGVYNEDNILNYAQLNTTFIQISFRTYNFHYGFYFRFYAKTDCQVDNPSLYYYSHLNPDSQIVTLPLTKGQFKLIQPTTLIYHNHSRISMRIGFNLNSSCTKNMISQIQFYQLKCDEGCSSCLNSAEVCLSCGTFYAHNNNTKKCEFNYNFCHSSCSSCVLPNNSNSCIYCYSKFTQLKYQSLYPNGGPCIIVANNNAQQLMLIDRNTLLSASFLQNVTLNNSTIYDQPSLFLNQFLYTSENIIQFKSSQTKTIQFGLNRLPIHKTILIRVTLINTCYKKGNNIIVILQGQDNKTTQQFDLQHYSLQLIETSIKSSSSTFKLIFLSNKNGVACSKKIKDVMLYFEKCQSFCGSNICPDSQPYFKHPTESKCVSECPPGYKSQGYFCVLIQLCHSTCSNCLAKNDPNKCNICQSNFTTFDYLSFKNNQNQGSCQLQLSLGIQKVMVIDKNTVFGSSYLKKVTFNKIVFQVYGQQLRNFLYTENIILLSSLSQKSIKFEFDEMNIDQKVIYLRTKVYSQCQDGSQISISWPAINKSETIFTLNSYQEKIIQVNQILCMENFFLNISLIQKNSSCLIAIQDISIYKGTPQICDQYGCELVYYKSPFVSQCIQSCPQFYYPKGHYCETASFCHSSCQTCEEKNNPQKCLSCSSNISSLNYQDFSDNQTMSSCQMKSNNNAQQLMIIDKNTDLKTSLLKYINFNNTFGYQKKLSEFLYTENTINLQFLKTDYVQFSLSNLPIHKKIIVRGRIRASCPSNHQLKVKMYGYQKDSSIQFQFIPKIQGIIEAEFINLRNHFDFTIFFDPVNEVCQKLIQDISIYYEKCESYCESNQCPDKKPYFKHPTQKKCVNDCYPGFGDWKSRSCVGRCDPGYLQKDGLCVLPDLCHSSCETCSEKNDPQMCSSCSSGLSSLTYKDFVNNRISGPCQMTSNYICKRIIPKKYLIGQCDKTKTLQKSTS